jgi:hypothetical protein
VGNGAAGSQLEVLSPVTNTIWLRSWIFYHSIDAVESGRSSTMFGGSSHSNLIIEAFDVRDGSMSQPDSLLKFQ